MHGQKSTDSFIFVLYHRLLSQLSKLHSANAQSSYETEYIAIKKIAKKSFYVTRFLACLSFLLCCRFVNLRAENKEAILRTKNPKSFQKIKHT